MRQYDGAWTGISGESVFHITAWGEGAAGSSPTSYALEDLRDIHGINAQRCSEDRRGFQALINKIEAASAAFDRSNGTKP